MASDSQAFPSAQEATSNILESKGGWFRLHGVVHIQTTQRQRSSCSVWAEQAKVSRWPLQLGLERKESKALKSTENGV